MSETQMPAAEAVGVMLENEEQAYELAFHILPTVAEGEVPSVFEAIKALITKDGGVIFDEEAPERFELAYEIEKHLEGKNRKYTSAYFGWIRFKSSSDTIEALLEEVDGRADILRRLLLKLTKVEEENPFQFHKALESVKKVVTTINEEDLVKAPEEVEESAGEGKEEEVDMVEVEKALTEDEVK